MRTEQEMFIKSHYQDNAKQIIFILGGVSVD